MTRLFKLFIDSFENFSSEHKRMRIIAGTGCYFSPIEFVIGKRCTGVHDQINESLIEISLTATALLFPLRDIFKRIFEIPSAFDTIFNY